MLLCLVKGILSMPGIEDSQEITFLRPNLNNQTVRDQLWRELLTNHSPSPQLELSRYGAPKSMQLWYTIKLMVSCFRLKWDVYLKMINTSISKSTRMTKLATQLMITNHYRKKLMTTITQLVFDNDRWQRIINRN